MKINFIFFFILLNIFYSFSNNLDVIGTTLVIIDEEENNILINGNITPFSEGIFAALWDKEYLFFDSKIAEPLKLVYNQLDIKPFLMETRNAGADTLLLIKINYDVNSKGSKIVLKLNEVYFNLYSLVEMKSLKVGKKKLNINTTLTLEEKNKFLKQVGYDVLFDIYDN
ncbi:MAG TPA: hypothetical protein PLE45_05950 [Spirochaetota bacterium]|nr:hypothetical protein [Spirochaetota bacterium]HOL56816.1 hypothetical protein [Spirochaetota bacterium]HPP04236.1 hypothetical protein [Spirochaetota bacterium]